MMLRSSLKTRLSFVEDRVFRDSRRYATLSDIARLADGEPEDPDVLYEGPVVELLCSIPDAPKAHSHG